MILRLAVVSIGLFILSAAVVAIGAAESPYHHPIKADQAIIQVGLGVGLIACWAVWFGVILLRIRQRRLPGMSAAAALLPALASFYLASGAIGYISEVRSNAWVPLTPTTVPPTTLPATYPIARTVSPLATP